MWNDLIPKKTISSKLVQLPCKPICCSCLNRNLRFREINLIGTTACTKKGVTQPLSYSPSLGQYRNFNLGYHVLFHIRYRLPPSFRINSQLEMRFTKILVKVPFLTTFRTSILLWAKPDLGNSYNFWIKTDEWVLGNPPIQKYAMTSIVPWMLFSNDASQ